MERLNESFAGHFIVGICNIVKILNRVIVVAYWMILNKPDYFAVFTVRERPTLYTGVRTLLTTSSV